MTDGSDGGCEALAQIILRLGAELGHPLNPPRAEELARAIWPQFRAVVAEVRGQRLDGEAAGARHGQEARNGQKSHRERAAVQRGTRRLEAGARTASRFGGDRSVGEAVRGAIDRLRGARDARGAGGGETERGPTDRFEFSFQGKRVGVFRLDGHMVSTAEGAGEATLGLGRWFYTVDGREYAGPKASFPVDQEQLEEAIRADLERLMGAPRS